jgi:hypothetical protein
MKRYDSEYDSSIEKEMEFIKFLGYHVDDCKLSGNWAILDENNKEIGSLTSDGEIYHTIIDSNKVHYDNEGELTGCYFKAFSYDIKGKGHVRHRLTKDCGSGTCRFLEYSDGKMSIAITATSHGSKHFDVSYSFKEKGWEMHTSVEYSYESGKYKYWDSLKSEILGIDDFLHIYTDPPTFDYDPTKSLPYTKSVNYEWETFEYDGTVEDFAKEHQKGIELVDKVRKIINEIMPHDGDVLDYMFSENIVNVCRFNIFFPNYQKESEKTR